MLILVLSWSRRLTCGFYFRSVRPVGFKLDAGPCRCCCHLYFVCCVAGCYCLSEQVIINCILDVCTYKGKIRGDTSGKRAGRCIDPPVLIQIALNCSCTQLMFNTGLSFWKIYQTRLQEEN
jgi:hypothetical protein